MLLIHAPSWSWVLFSCCLFIHFYHITSLPLALKGQKRHFLFDPLRQLQPQPVFYASPVRAQEIEVQQLASSTTPKYPAILQPEYDGFNLTQYFRTPAQVKFQVRCFFYNEPCDLLARWAKPRFPDAIFGKCDNCTEMQRTYLDDAFMGLHDRMPVLFTTAVAVVLEHYGIPVPREHRLRIAKEFE